MLDASQLIPLADRIIVERKEAEDVTEGGIKIPETAREKPQMGIVRATGPGREGRPMEIKVGDVVIFTEYAGMGIAGAAGQLEVMSQDDIVCVVVDTDAR